MIDILDFEVGHYEAPYNEKWLSGPSYNWSYSIKFGFTNNFDKTIKYITFYVVPFDRVMEPINCTLFFGGNQTAKLKYTGPIEPQETVEDVVFERLVESESLGDILLKKIDIVFMDETTESIYTNKFMSQIKEGGNEDVTR